MTDMTTKERLFLACFILACAFGSLAWVGGRTVAKALDSVEKNTEFRIVETERMRAVERRLESIESKVELLPEMFSYMKRWESAE